MLQCGCVGLHRHLSMNTNLMVPSKPFICTFSVFGISKNSVDHCCFAVHLLRFVYNLVFE